MNTKNIGREVRYAFSVGQSILAFDRDAKWRAAIITSLAPQRGEPGYYISWDPAPVTDPSTGIRLSAGGWQPERCVRAHESGACTCAVCQGQT